MIDDFEKYEETKSFLVRTEGAINNSFTWMHDSPKFKDYAPKDLQDKVSEFLTYIKKYDVEKMRPASIETEGDFFDEKKLKIEIQKVTGYVWKVRKMDEDEMMDHGFTQEDIEYNEGIKPSKIKAFEFYRPSKSRGELWLVQLVLMPGCAFIDWDSGRAGGRTKVHNTSEKLIKEFNKECCG
ncbi:MAG: hypothetical protein AABY15_03020 [Nanoarchaeota archaeon]